MRQWFKQLSGCRVIAIIYQIYALSTLLVDGALACAESTLRIKGASRFGRNAGCILAPPFHKGGWGGENFGKNKYLCLHWDAPQINRIIINGALACAQGTLRINGIIINGALAFA